MARYLKAQQKVIDRALQAPVRAAAKRKPQRGAGKERSIVRSR